MTPNLPNTTHPTQYPCPQCKKPTTWADNRYKPFCSDRCKLIDLGAWASESYKVPALESSPMRDDFDPLSR